MESIKFKPTDIKKQWVTVDAKGKTLGRLASEISRILRGKNKTYYTPHLDIGDNVIVINAANVKLTGSKLQSKFYYHHSSFIGGIKATSAGEMLATHPERVIQAAVKGMVPRNRLGRKVAGRLKIYAGSEHPHISQNPVAQGPRLKGRDPSRV